MDRLRSVSLLLAGLHLAGSYASAQPSFRGLGVPPGSASSSTATDISADGTCVVGHTWDGVQVSAFRWTASTGTLPIHPPFCIEECSSIAGGVSADGSVVAGDIVRWNEVEHHPFRWTPVDAETLLHPITKCPNPSWGFLTVSDDGSTLAGYALLCNAWRWTEELGVAELGTLPGCTSYSLPFDISGDGAVIVGGCYVDTALRRSAAFRWTEVGGMVAIGDLAGGEVSSIADAASHDGSVIVGRSSSKNNTQALHAEAFRWTSTLGMSALGDLIGGAFDSRALGVSADGSVVVGRGTSATGRRAFIWTHKEQIQDLGELLATRYALDLSGWTLTEAIAVSADGRVICGNGTNPQGAREAWIASLGRCPADFNCDGFVNSQDFFDFLTAFFAANPAADFNADGFINSQDFFDFLAAFFMGCP